MEKKKSSSYLFFKQRYQTKDVPYETCPKCGANLDKGEICQDCKKKEAQEKEGGG